MSISTSMSEILAFRESVGFKAGQSYERRRIEELLHKRVAELSALLKPGTPQMVQRNARAAIGELGNLLTLLLEAG